MSHELTSGTPIVFDRVTRWYGPVAGILEVSFSLGAGVYGLLGPNGAGKSTILNLAAGLINPGMGRVEIFGRSPFWSTDNRGRIGFMPETEAFPPGVTGDGFLRTSLRLAGVPWRQVRARSAELLDRVGLSEARKRRVRGYSRGMKQRLKLAQAIGHGPDLLLLDEPLTGLDPLARRKVISLVQEMGNAGKCVLVSSHILHEVESMTSSVIFLNQGRILAEGNVHEIRSHLADQPVQVRVATKDTRRLAATIVGWPAVTAVKVKDGFLDVEAGNTDEFFDELGELACQEWAGINEMRILDENLEAVFDYLVQ